MKTLMIAAAGIALSVGAAFADPIEGMWKTQPDDGSYAYVQIAPCGAAFCGTIVKTFKSGGEYKSPNIGKQLVIGMAPKGGGKYEGKVWRPSNNKIYLGKVTVNGNAMALAGCVAGGLFCKSQDWQRVK
ncbi:MAG: DUF2147 domain-containing protein [Rhodobacteraceae bacterium]|jgi:Uncharacterized protein conserved in bacteria|uniref:Imidazoleglycerol-phosphate dehydratase n=1 Tax=Thioclava marina TaxID=1915077 RepID=A0ABX3MNP8_9RHOB|nr:MULTISPECIES: DUF2147 domain-containing protein [Bacteria]TNE93039.1 MAG: DUF2147 domain-containing protein [Paracoccaceae bacterium]MBD3758672.1 DUF2147 domain-containing protein [Microbacterium sp.]OOY13166.1 imidazoleglycerol-phosphate dehydratase [Thioclava marina]OOY28878.1 imidazoleglycerol-phosphate dehydratase [Thioclava sp. L04-15]TNF11243.1 MAG: DUF2147 domain-containing protein [Paracoccaceae bacterium]